MMRWVMCIAFLFFLGCNESQHEGYDRLWESLHYRHEVLGDESAVADNPDSYVSLHISVVDAKGKTVISKRIERVPVKNLLAQGQGLNRAILSMNEKDSTSFKGRVADLEFGRAFPTLAAHPDSVVSFTVHVSELLDDEAFRRFKADERAMNDREMLEMHTLSYVLDSLGLDDDDEIAGMYFKSIREGKGARPLSGSMVWVNYIGRFPSGEVFDNTYKGKLALEYQIGKPDQVIPGFGIGVSRMKQGGKALFVIPSNLGFGEKGSSSKIVPPYSTLIYEVNLIRVGV